MTDFHYASWLATISMTLLLGLLLIRRRELIIKPSILFVMFFHLQVQIPAAFQIDKILYYLENPWPLFLLTHIFPLLCLLLSSVTFRQEAVDTYARVTNTNMSLANVGHRAILFCSIIVILLSWYLTVVPLSKTGLFAIIFIPELSAVARENSYKLLGNRFLQYGIGFMVSVFASLGMAFLYLTYAKIRQHGRRLDVIWIASGIIMILFAVSIYGARAPSGLVVMAALFAFYLRNGASFNPVKILLLVGAVLLIPAAMSLLRHGIALNLDTASEAALNILDRAVGRGFRSSIWYMDYAERHGLVGIAGIPKLASLVGVAPIHLSNIVSLQYSASTLPSGTAGSAFVYQYYCLFGFAVFVPCIVMVLSLDLIMLFYRHLRSSSLLACVAALSIPMLALSFNQFTTVLFTKGFLFIPLVCLVLDNAFGRIVPRIIRNHQHRCKVSGVTS